MAHPYDARAWDGEGFIPRSVATDCPLDQSVTRDTFAQVKTISIKQLHAETGRWVRAARKTPVIVTDRGEEVAVLNSREKADLPRAVFTLANRRPRPRIEGDSTALISEDRDAR